LKQGFVLVLKQPQLHQSYYHRFDTMTKPKTKQTKGFSMLLWDLGTKVTLTKMPKMWNTYLIHLFQQKLTCAAPQYVIHRNSTSYRGLILSDNSIALLERWNAKAGK